VRHDTFQREKTSLLYHAASTQRIIEKIDRPTLRPWAAFYSRLCFIRLTLTLWDTATDHQRLGRRLGTFSNPCGEQHSFLDWALFHLPLGYSYSVKGHVAIRSRFSKPVS